MSLHMDTKKKSITKLDILAEKISKDLPIQEVEKLELEYKKTIKHLVGTFPNDHEAAYAIALSQKRIGLIKKYKSYGVKLSTPLGYSIFLLNPGQGFSFQNHIDSKVELFLTLKVNKGGYIYISEYKKWLKDYNV